MYSITGYGNMIADQIRTGAYAGALRRVVGPNSVVLDLGAGTGIMSLLACQCGARHVFAIEPDDVIQLARELVHANGFDERVTFFQRLSTEVDLPERAHVIVFDLRGVLPWFERSIPSIVDARRRLLAPGGTLIPQCDTLWAAVVEAPETYSKLVTPWEDSRFGLEMRGGRRFAVNAISKLRVQPEQLLSQPQNWFTLDYRCVEATHVEGNLTAAVQRAGTAHGLVVWYDTVLAEGIGYSNAPQAPETIYRSAFLPLLEPVAVQAGDSVAVKLHANLVADDYVWRWETRLADAGDATKGHFEQSTFFGLPFSPAQLRKRALNYTPTLNPEGEVAQFILAEMQTGITLETLAAHVAARFPLQFRSVRSAISCVSELSLKYSR